MKRFRISLLLVGFFAFMGVASAQTVASGTTGDCTWTLTGSEPNLTLTISGTGAMENYTDNSAMPWYSQQSSIETLVIAPGVTSIGSYAFSNSDLTSVTFATPSSVTSIGSYAFYQCTDLTALTIPEAVTSIGEGAFYSCFYLTALTIPEAVTSIGSYAFYYCSGLTALTIPEAVTSIGEGAFYYCSNLSLSVSNTSTYFTVEDGVLFNKAKTTLLWCPQN
jgi:hypothetical protein